MAGNVYQFCSSHMTRGGSWVTHADGCRVAGGLGGGSTFSVGYIGFRSVLPAGQ
jgi:formylglycine-generating enzyme required for sulfatase activity